MSGELNKYCKIMVATQRGDIPIMDYVWWNPWAWGLFLVGVAVCFVSLKLFHKRYPNYPWGGNMPHFSQYLNAETVMAPIYNNFKTAGSIPKKRVRFDDPAFHAENMLAQGYVCVGVEDKDGQLIGLITDQEFDRFYRSS